MSATSTPSSVPPGAGDLYRKLSHVNRRRLPPVHRVDSTGDGTHRRSSSDNPVKEAMIRSVRKFVIFSAAMIALLYLCIKALFFVWRIKDSRLFSSSPPPPAAAPAAASAPIVAEGDAPPSTTIPPGANIDTESIRKAVFLARRGEALEADGKFPEAIARYREALDIWPHLTDTWAKLGACYLRVKDFTRAQSSLERAVENSPTSSTMLNDLGVAYLYGGSSEKAGGIFDTAIEISPDFAPSYFNRALASIARNDRPAARKSLEQFLQLKPNDPRALRETAYIDAASGKYDEAMNSLEKALAESPDWPLLYFDAAATAALMGNFEKALRYLEQAEPLTSAPTVYRLYQEPAFNQIRKSELGYEFGESLASRASKAIAAARAPVEPNRAPEPLSSVSAEL